jgi:hypothetical protein
VGKFDKLIEKYSEKGVSADNIAYAISAVKDGIRREHILESLTADYRGMNSEQSIHLLEDLFAANGGEFKKENRGGYLYATMFLLIGCVCAFFILSGLYYGEVPRKPVLFLVGATGGIGGGIYYLTKSLKGKFRDEDEPFKN